MRYFVVDAFTDTLFKGNPAGVCLVEPSHASLTGGWPSDQLMQSIAAENNLSETAFILVDNVTPIGGDSAVHYELRWFTPELEVDLCGHATLASAFIISNYVDKNASLISFQTVSGRLGVTCSDGLYELDFPARPAVPIAVTPEMSLAIGAPVLEAYKARDYMFVVESDTVVRDLVPDFAVMRLFEDCLGVIVTAEAASGSQADFVSRFFVPIAGIPEDAVTGSSHCTLIPFWSERLNKQKMLARQLSLRGGELHCENRGARVLIGGGAVLYMQGEILL